MMRVPHTGRPSSIGALKQMIKVEKSNSFQRVDAVHLKLRKVDVDVGAVEDKILRGEYWPVASDNPQPLESATIIASPISEVWPDPPPRGRLHVFIRRPDEVALQTISFPKLPKLHNAAKILHEAMWQYDLGERLQECEDLNLKYLPATVVKDLQLRELGCNAKVILVREEYILTMGAPSGEAPEQWGGDGSNGSPRDWYEFVAEFCSLTRYLQPVALQHGGFFFIFRQDGVEMYNADSLGLVFRSERPWALSDSTESSRSPCRTFQEASRMGCAWVVQTTSQAEKFWKGWRRECYTGLFIMECFAREEARALSNIYGLNAERFLEYFTKWGPSARTCLRLAWGSLTEDQLQREASRAANKFAANPTAIDMDPNSDVALFITLPTSPTRDVDTLRVATPYLYDLIVQAIARSDAAGQVSFYANASNHPYFRGAFGHVFEKYFAGFGPRRSTHRGTAIASRITRASRLPHARPFLFD